MPHPLQSPVSDDRQFPLTSTTAQGTEKSLHDALRSRESAALNQAYESAGNALPHRMRKLPLSSGKILEALWEKERSEHYGVGSSHLDEVR